MAVGAGGLAWAAGMGQADLAARGQGPVGLPRFLPKQATAFGCGQERLVDLAVVEGAGGDEVVEVAGRLPQLPVAVADGSGGDPGELLGQGRPRIAVWPGGAWGRKLYRMRGSLWRSALQPGQQHRGDLARGHLEGAAGDPPVGVARGVAAGWGDHIAASAPPIHMHQPGRVDVAEAGGGQVEVPATPAGADQRPRTVQAVGGGQLLD